MTAEQLGLKYPETLEAVADIARGAAELILEVYDGADFEVEQKQDDSPLTLADRRAHEFIESALTRLTPAIPVLSEESKLLPFTQRRRWTRYWLVDPLDGTKEFIGRNGEFTVNIALVEDGVATLGVVHVPVSGVTYSGLCGEAAEAADCAGAWRREGGVAKTIVSTRVEGRRVRVVASRRHRGERLETLLGNIETACGLEDVVSIGSSLKMCLVAEGAADIYPRLAPTSEWDTAAAHAIVRAAGGEILDLDFRPLRYNTKESLLNPEFVALGDTDYDWRALFAEL